MNLKTYVLAGLATAVLSVTTFAADAQSAGAKPAAQPAAAPGALQAGPPPTSVTAGLPQDKSSANRPVAQNWLKVCDPIKQGKASGQKACMMRQIIVANHQFLGSFLLRDDPGQESRLFAVAAVPLGVLLPVGITWQIDGQKPIRVPYMLCDPQSCASELVISQQYLNMLRKGQKLTLVAKTRGNKDLVVDVNLTGFGQVYDSQTAMTIDDYRKASGSAALEQTLQDRAEQLRKQLDNGGAAPAAATPAPANGG